MIENYVLIIGAMKAGTTTLFRLLSRHPAIAPSRHKEPGFFAFPDRWAEGFDWYEGFFAFDPAQHRYGLEASTDYTKHPFVETVPERLAASAPRRFKLIYMTRDPFARIESHARHTQRTRRELGFSVSPRADHSLDAGVSPVSIATTRYADQLDRFEAFAEAGDLLTIKLEDFQADQTAGMARVTAFLGLAPLSDVEYTHSNSVKDGVHHPPRYFVKYGLPYETLRAHAPRRVQRWLGIPPSREEAVEGRFHLTETERASLLDRLGDDLIRLRDRWGIDYLNPGGATDAVIADRPDAQTAGGRKNPAATG